MRQDKCLGLAQHGSYPKIASLSLNGGLLDLLTFCYCIYFCPISSLPSLFLTKGKTLLKLFPHDSQTSLFTSPPFLF